MVKLKTLLAAGFFVLGLYSVNAMADGRRDKAVASQLENKILDNGLYSDIDAINKIKESNTVQEKLAEEENTSVAKEEPKKASHNGTASVGIGYGKLNINEKDHSEGLALLFLGEQEIELLDKLSLDAELMFMYQKLGAFKGNCTLDRTDLDFSIESKVRIYESEKLELFLAAGAEYVMERHAARFAGHKGYKMINSTGPKISLSIESEHADFTIFGSVLLGEGSYSYDIDRSVYAAHAGLEITPKAWKLEMPIKYEYFYYDFIDKQGANPKSIHRLTSAPSVDVSKNISFFTEVSVDFVTGEEHYWDLKAGGGVKLKW